MLGYGAFDIPDGLPTVTVTNLNNSGSGSLREAVEVLTYPRRIVVQSGLTGWIDLINDIVCSSNYVIMDLSGLGIRYGGMNIRGAHYVYLKNLRAYRGGNDETSLNNGDSITVYLSSYVVVDHCIARWSVDECLSVSSSNNVTIQYCQIEEGLNNALPSKIDHSKGTLVLYSQYVSIVRNFYGQQKDRTPQVSNSKDVEVINNLIYNSELGMLVAPQETITTIPNVDFIGNVWLDGFLSTVESGASIRATLDDSTAPPPLAFVEDNLTRFRVDGAAQIRAVHRGYLAIPDEDSQRVAVSDGSGAYLKLTPYNGMTEALLAVGVQVHVIANVGVENRIADDNRVLNTIINGTNSVIGQTDVFIDEAILGVPSASNQRQWPIL